MRISSDSVILFLKFPFKNIIKDLCIDLALSISHCCSYKKCEARNHLNPSI